MKATTAWLGAIAVVAASVAAGWWGAQRFGPAAHPAPARVDVGAPSAATEAVSAAPRGALPFDARQPLQLRVTGVLLRHGDAASSAAPSQALISVNGEPARLFAVGAVVHEDLLVRRIAADRVRIANDDSTMVFDLAVEAPPSQPAIPVNRGGAAETVAQQILQQGGGASPPTSIGTAAPTLAPMPTATAQAQAQPQAGAGAAAQPGAGAPAVSIGTASPLPAQAAQQPSTVR